MRKYDKPLTPRQIAAVKDRDIDLSDIPELDDDFWRNARLVEPDLTQQVTLRVKRSVLAFFKAPGKGYQSRMNRVLESFVRAQGKNQEQFVAPAKVDEAVMDDKYVDELSEKYLGCMREIKHRIDVIQGYIENKWHAGYLESTAEGIALQFRKTLELIALASLVANREEYAKQRGNFSKDWNAKRIVDTLERINPGFYPEPSKPERLEANDFVDYDLRPVPNYLTRDDYILLFDKCSDLLHSANPYSKSQPPYDQFMNEAPDWLRKTIALLNHHHIRPLDANMMFVVQMGREDEDVSLASFAKLGSAELLDTEAGRNALREKRAETLKSSEREG